jgi:hypothetical protein
LARPQSLEGVARQLPASAWRRVTWRQGSRGAQCSRFVMLIADYPCMSIKTI